MYLSTAPLKSWLKQQHQMIGKCTSAYLVSIDNGNAQVVAQSPDNIKPDKSTQSAIKEVLQKQRLHLAPMGDKKILLAQPITLQGKLWGAVILELAIDDKKDVPASLKLLQSGMVWLQFILVKLLSPEQKMANAPSVHLPAKDTPHAAQLLHIMNSLLKENSLQETAISLVNFLATQMQAARVCLGLQGKSGIELMAVSFSANFDKRTSAMQAVSDAMDEAVDQRANIHVAATALNANSSTIQRCHEHLIKLQQVAAVDSFLLRKESQIVGVIILESKDTKISQEQKLFLDAVLLMVRDVIALKQESETNIRQQIKSHTARKLSSWFGENKLTRKLITAAVLLTLVILLVPADYWISNDANLQSTSKFLLVSPQDGYLASINVRPGASVKKGDLLAQLNDEELHLERRKLFSQMQQAQQEYDNALASANRVGAAIANEKVAQANSQLQLIEQQQMRTQLISPSDGIITSDDISQSLGAPVKQGQILFEISAQEGYLVQLWVDERDIAAVRVGQSGKIKLTSIPKDVFDVSVKSITPISEIREGKNYFRVEATLNQDVGINQHSGLNQSIELLRPGMTGSGKILAGREPLGWIWFHDLWYWLRLKLWF